MRYFGAILLSDRCCSRSVSAGDRPITSAKSGPPKQPIDYRVRGMAGEHQIEGARLALGHAYGGGSQYISMWIVSGEQP